MIRDWTYESARLRLLLAGRAHLPSHLASVELDEVGNRVVKCSCGWRGNGLGWIDHVDEIVCASLSD